MRRFKAREFFAVLLAMSVVWLLPTAVLSQQVPPAQAANRNNRPKIGLVLSGGGARGIAHIGVLKWFEENRIPIDYVSGTSIGGLVGGMYATGRTPDEMRRIIGSIDWNDALRGSPAYDELSFRRKQDRRDLQNEIELGLRNGITTGSGLNPGHKIGLIFDRLTLPFSTVENFDALPVPLRVVATDMVEAKPVVIGSGQLSTALRATMAIPGVFTPVERDGKILADGGLVNNIPTDVAKQMGADVVIAVDIGTPLSKDPKTLESLGGVLSQTIGVALIENDRRNLRLADIIIAPDLGSYTIFDFQAAQNLYELGYKGAAEKSSVLKKFALDDAAWAEYVAEKRSKITTDVPVPQSIEVAGASREETEQIIEKLDDNVGKALAAQEIERDLTRIRGNGRYESLGYEIRRENGANKLVVRAKEKNYGPPFFTPSIEIESAGSDNVYATLGGRFTFFDVGGYRSELRADVKLGSRTLLAAEYYKPVGGSGFFVAPRAYYDKQARNLFAGERRVAEYGIRRAGIGLDAGYTFRRSEFRAGVDYGDLSARVRIGDPLLAELEGAETKAFARYEFDSTDEAVIPTKGVRLFGEARYFFKNPGANGGFTQAESRISAFRPVGEKGVVFLTGAGGTSFHKDASPLAQFTLGGPLRLGALRRDELVGNHYLFAGAGYLRSVYALPSIIGGRVYLFGGAEAGGAFNRLRTSNAYLNATGGIVVVTAFGPISLGGSFGEGGRRRAYFSIGRIF
jgi:NTE family protein